MSWSLFSRLARRIAWPFRPRSGASRVLRGLAFNSFGQHVPVALGSLARASALHGAPINGREIETSQASLIVGPSRGNEKHVSCRASMASHLQLADLEPVFVLCRRARCRVRRHQSDGRGWLFGSVSAGAERLGIIWMLCKPF